MSAGAVIVGGVESMMVTNWSAEAELPESSVAVQVTTVVPTGKPSDGALLVTVGAGSSSSLTVGVPNETGVRGAVASSVTPAGAVMDGALVSVIVTTCVSAAELPLSSVAVQVTIVVATGNPPEGASLVTVGDGSAESLAVGDPRSIIVDSPVAAALMSGGATIDGAVVSVIVTICVEVAELPLSSVAVQVTTVVPTGKPSAGASLVTDRVGSAMSLAVGVPNETGVRDEVASIVTSAGAVMDGGVVSVMVTV
jgi:hypothetical protein